jgi:hypothetical protein
MTPEMMHALPTTQLFSWSARGPTTTKTPALALYSDAAVHGNVPGHQQKAYSEVRVTTDIDPDQATDFPTPVAAPDFPALGNPSTFRSNPQMSEFCTIHLSPSSNATPAIPVTEH